jgi:hypothetical protein
MMIFKNKLQSAAIPSIALIAMSALFLLYPWGWQTLDLSREAMGTPILEGLYSVAINVIGGGVFFGLSVLIAVHTFEFFKIQKSKKASSEIVGINEASSAIKWSCEHCKHTQYSDDTLSEDTYKNDPVRSNVVDCEKCGKENKVILFR